MSKCQAQITHSFSLQSCWQWPCASRLLSVFSCLLHPSSSGWKTLLGWQSWKHWHRKMGIYFSWGVAPCLLRASRGWRWGQVAKTTLWDLFIVLPHVQLWDTEQRVEHGSEPGWKCFLQPQKAGEKEAAPSACICCPCCAPGRWKKLCCLLQRSPWSTGSAVAAAGNAATVAAPDHT